jgi:intracellular septation protein A
MNLILSKIFLVANAASSVKLPDPLGGAKLPDIINKIFEFAAFTAGPIVVTAMVIVGAYQMLFANGEAEKFTKGKNTIVFTIIGYALLLMATGISKIVQSALTGNL